MPRPFIEIESVQILNKYVTLGLESTDENRTAHPVCILYTRALEIDPTIFYFIQERRVYCLAARCPSLHTSRDFEFLLKPKKAKTTS